MSSETATPGSKRSGDDGEVSVTEAKKPRGGNAGPLTLRFLIKGKHAGGVIGKGGETIKRLRNTYDAHVNVPQTHTNERVLIIGAQQEQCIEVLKECLPLMLEPPYSVNTPGKGDPNSYEVDFLVHTSQVGGIIGKGGANVKKIREETQSKIKIYSDPLPSSSERVVAIGGQMEALISALNQMLGILETEPIKGNVVLYDPSHQEHATGYDYGPPGNAFGAPGFDGMGRGAGGGRGHGGFRGQRGGAPRGGNSFRGGYGGPGAGGGGMGYGGYGGDAGGYGGNSGGGYNDFNSAPSTTQVTVTNDMAGCIIGKGGSRIKDIRQTCGANIKFSESEEANGERLITISGTQDQIQHAQYLMQQCVRENLKGS